jgi:hypothetical protein
MVHVCRVSGHITTSEFAWHVSDPILGRDWKCIPFIFACKLPIIFIPVYYCFLVFYFLLPIVTFLFYYYFTFFF